MENRKRGRAPAKPATGKAGHAPQRRIPPPKDIREQPDRHPQTGHRFNIPAHVGGPFGPMPHPIDGIPHHPRPPRPAPRPKPAPGPKPGPGPKPAPGPIPLAPHSLRLQFILTTNTVPVDPATILTILPQLNQFFAAGSLSFTFDPALDYAVIDSTLLDRDWQVIDPASLGNPQAAPPALDTAPYHAERQRVARAYRGKVVVYISRGSDLAYDANSGVWTVVERGFHYSSALGDYVATSAAYWRPPLMPPGIDPNTLAHELGHYLHNVHTMFSMPKTVAEAANVLRQTVDAWGWNPNDAPAVFDADLPFVADTPPDPGPDLFAAANGDACSVTGFVDVPVTFSSGVSRTYRLQPDRENLMSYFKGCPGNHHFSRAQFDIMRCALEHGNRRHLLLGYELWLPKPPVAFAYVNGQVGLVTLDVTPTPWFQNWNGGATPAPAPWMWLGQFIDSICGVVDGMGNLDLVGRDTTGRIRHKSIRNGVTTPQYTWSFLGAETFPWEPVVVSPTPGRLDAFVCARDGTLRWKSNTGGGWSGAWQSLGGSCMGTPAVVCTGPHRIDVVAWQTDRSAAHRSWDGARWSAWTPLGGAFSAEPAMAAWAGGRLEVVGRGTDDALYHKATTNSTSWTANWTWLGGAFTGRPALVKPSANVLEIVARNSSGTMWHKQWTLTALSPDPMQWRLLGGQTVGSPTLLVTAEPSGRRRLDIFARDAGNAILHTCLDGNGDQLPGPGTWTATQCPAI